MKFEKPHSQVVLCMLALCLLGGGIYANSLRAPWYFDDFPWIVENPAIRNLGATLANMSFVSRGVASLTFALNYRFGGLVPEGYHAFNIIIHVISSGVLLLILRRVFRENLLLPFAGALIFLAHPIQTQAVTYVIQRHASLCGLFWLFSLLFFIKARDALSAGNRFVSKRHLAYYLLSLGSAALAIGSKQNAAMIPVTLALFDRYFLSRGTGGWGRLAGYLAPYLVAPVWLATLQVVQPLAAGGDLQEITGLDNPFVPNAKVSSWTYLLTQFEVLWLYLRLLFLPYGQTLDYAYPVAKGFGTLKTISAFSGLVALFVAAYLLRRRARLVSFGILWFFAAIAVEATVIPLDLVFEHRLYVPMIGFVLVVLALLSGVSNRKVQCIALVVMVGVYSGLTVERNALWSDKLAFYEDNLRKAPHNTRVYLELSKLYLERGQSGRAETVLKAGIRELPLYVAFHNNLGSLYEMEGNPELALQYYRRALEIDPAFDKAYTNLGVLHANQGRWAQAVEMYRRSLELKPGNARAHYNLGVALYRLDDRAGALTAFREAVALQPDDADALYNLGFVAAEVGDRQESNGALRALRRIDPVRAEQLREETAAQ